MTDRNMTRREFTRGTIAGMGALAFAPLTFAQSARRRSDWSDKFADEGAAFVPGSFTIAAIPDTQFYSARWPHHFNNITRWIREHREKHNIQFVIHLGDVTDNNNNEQWETARKAMATLDGQVPYSIMCGNHDLGENGDCGSRDTLFNDYFKVSEQKKHSMLGGVFEPDRLNNSYHTFTAAGQKYLVIALEFAPRHAAVEWANQVAAKHPDHLAILTTHAYLNYDNNRLDYAKFGDKQRLNPHRYELDRFGGVNDGQELWDKVVSKHKGFFMAIGGHIANDGLGRITSPGAGGDVHELLVNYQNRHEGGEGYLRLMEFHPDGKTVQIKAYSPSTGKYKVDRQNQFTLELNRA